MRVKIALGAYMSVKRMTCFVFFSSDPVIVTKTTP